MKWSVGTPGLLVSCGRHDVRRIKVKICFVAVGLVVVSPLALTEKTSLVFPLSSFHLCPTYLLLFCHLSQGAYLRSLETSETKLQIVDFAETTASSATGATEDAKIEGAVQIAIGVKKEVDFASWYINVLIKADMLDYYSYSIWKEIQRTINFGQPLPFVSNIKELGVQNSSFLMFVSAKVLERDKDHIEGFSPEVKWVTRAFVQTLLFDPGNLDLKRPIAIRTSETAVYPSDYAKWIKSHRDLPLNLDQRNTIFRWKSKPSWGDRAGSNREEVLLQQSMCGISGAHGKGASVPMVEEAQG
ncbi:hypothetical protein F5887DRAFT_917383 [Amanita rubescens]|nr:hypothetical protein F5887DRAFT_917383 [Amanita rubescens]